MYKSHEKTVNIENNSFKLYGIADENGFICDFTPDRIKNDKLINMLNKNDVERCHVKDIVCDIIFSEI